MSGEAPSGGRAGDRCGVCGGEIGPRWPAREMMLGLRTRFTYGACDTCGALQLLDPPEDFRPFYGDGYYSFADDLEAEFAEDAVRAAQGQAVRRLLAPEVPEAQAPPMPGVRRALLAMRPLGLQARARVLDVGCGAGRLPYLLHLAGFAGVEGADAFLAVAPAYARGPRIHKARLEEMEGGWDVIMLHHAFEHLGDPVGALRAVAARLAASGRVLLRLPLCDSYAWRRYRSDWVQLDAPRHLFLHTRASLARAAAAAGLVVERVVCDSYEFQFWGSEQYRLDIPLNAPGGWRHGAGAPLFTPAQLA
ncbi:MAG: methyltransferase domain-containing protein, partial [Caulobacteraceae bacterium]|nr:methyltransferase domain-containing protein [Caulobacter sp.]